MIEETRSTEAFPGGISVSHLRVYDTPAADGLVGGSPHMHFACSEAYLVVNGLGSVQTLSSEGFREVPLRAGSLVWFTPGLIHRLINEDGHLDKLNVGASDYLNHGRVFEIPVDPEHQDRKLGMCGTLRPYLPEGELL